MTKDDFIRAIQSQPNLAGKAYTKTTIAAFLDAFSATLHEALVAKGEVTLRGIGKFSTRPVPASPERSGRNPATGAPVFLPAQPTSTKVVFKPAKELRDAVRAGAL